MPTISHAKHHPLCTVGNPLQNRSPANTLSRTRGDHTSPIVNAHAPFPIASEGQITVAKALRQPLGLSWGSRVKW
jgi:hypothetical protein